MSGSASIDFAAIIVPVAIQVLGCEPNESLCTKDEVRFGSRGAFAIDRRKGTWCDHSDGNAGGGVLDLLKVKKGLEKPEALKWLRDNRHIPAVNSGGFNIVATYDYVDAAGALLFQVCRLDPKDFRQRRPDPAARDGWTWKTRGVPKVLYRLPQVLAAARARQTVFVVEGEKSVHAMEAQGLVATCSPGGAGKWKEVTYSDALKGAEVIVLPDCDEPGEAHAEQVIRALKGKAWRARSLWLPDLPIKGDVVDYFAAGHTGVDLLAYAAETMPRDWQGTPHPADVDGGDCDDGAGTPLGGNACHATGTETDPPVATTDVVGEVRAVVDDFNARYLLVNEQGKAVILQPGFDPVLRRRTYDRLSVRDLQTFYMNRLVKVGEDEDGKAILKTAADVWLRHRDRKQFIHGVTFDPTSTHAKPGVLNLWEGFAVKPKRGDWSKMRWHIDHVMCGGVNEHSDYAIKWMARMVQRPAEQGEVAVVLKGVEGCGKGFVARALARIAGQHGIAISNAKHLVGNFNAHLRDSIFLFADEAFFAGDRSHTGVLKALITEPHLTIEGKFQNATSSPNFLHVMMASNEDWVVPASIEARRFFVLNVLPVKVGDHAYFAALHAEMEGGGYEAMLHDLLAMDLSTFNVRSVPNTDGLQQQRKLSLGTTEAWWLDCLERGYVFKSRLGLDNLLGVWLPQISTELLMTSYMEFAKSRGERRPISREALGEFFRAKLKAVSVRPRNGIIGEAMQDEPNAFGGTNRKALPISSPRPPSYILGNLDQARADFTTHTGLPVTWDGGVVTADGLQPAPYPSAAANADDPFGEMAAD